MEEEAASGVRMRELTSGEREELVEALKQKCELCHGPSPQCTMCSKIAYRFDASHFAPAATLRSDSSSTRYLLLFARWRCFPSLLSVQGTR